MEKKCSRCKQLFPLEELNSNRLCISCKTIYNKEYNERNRERTALYNKEYRSKNKEYLRKKSKEFSKKYYEDNKEKINNKIKLYRIKNKEKCKEYQRNYNIKNREKINKQSREGSKRRRNSSPQIKMVSNLRYRFKELLKGTGIRKHAKTLSLFGCYAPELKQYLESKFLPTMTWENYGKLWQIDHIIPCNYFDLTKEEEQRKCFHYTNLQPLFTVTTIIDGIEYIGNLNKKHKLFMFRNISILKFKELISKGYSIDMVYILSLLKDKIDVKLSANSEKINSIIVTLNRKGLIDNDENVTVDGDNLLKYINTINEESIKYTRLKVDDEFDLFWKIFPASDIFEYKGVKFTGSRALRINKEDCKVKLKAILNTGEFSITEIVEAVKYDVQCKMESSIKTKTNKLSYLQNSLTYLRQYSFLPFLELIKEGKVIKEETQKTFDGINI
jgi:hypothetical protein